MRKLVTFSLDPETVAIIGRVAASRCGDNASKAVRLIAREWAGVEKMRQPILTVIEESVAAQFDHEWTRVPLEGESDAD